MREKNLIILVVIFVLLLAGVYVKKSLRPSTAVAPEETAQVLSTPVSASNMDAITIHIGEKSFLKGVGEQTVRLVKHNGQWLVASQFGIQANESSVTALFETLNRLSGELRSNQQDVLGDYGIGEDEGVHVELQRAGADPLRVVVGSKKIGYQTYFVRLGGANAVYAVNDNVLGVMGVIDGDQLRLDPNLWADKRIAHIDVDAVTGITVKQKTATGQQTTLDIKSETADGRTQWVSALPYKFGLSAAKIKDTISAFNNTYAREVIDPKRPNAFDDPGWNITYTLNDGKTVTLVRGNKDPGGNNYYVKEEGREYYFVVPVASFQSREKQQGNIFAANPLNVDENVMESVEIRDLEAKKEFKAIKAARPKETAADPETATGEPAQPATAWQTPKGDALELTKVQDIISKLKDLNVEADIAPEASLANVMEIRLTSEGKASEFVISKDTTLENGKECHFLTVKGEGPSYCVAKAQMTALKNALP